MPASTLPPTTTTPTTTRPAAPVRGTSSAVAPGLAPWAPVAASSPATSARRARGRLRHALAIGVALAFAGGVPRDARAEDDLVAAARAGRFEQVEALLVAGRAADPTSPGYSALMWAAERGDVAMARRLLRAGADPAWHDHNGEFALGWAAREGRVATVRVLLDAGTKVDELDRWGRSALFAAAGAGHVEVVEELLARGADARRADVWGEAVLFPACQSGRTEVVRRLLAAGADAKVVRPHRKATPLHVAAERGDAALVDALVAAGAAVDALDEQEEAPLHAAARAGNDAATAALLAHGADPDGGGKAKSTPFELAVGREGDAVAPRLVERTRATGRALVAAAAAARPALVVQLVARVGVPLPAAEGGEALVAGARGGDVDVLRALLDAKASLERAGAAALVTAAGAGRDAAVALLLERGVAADARAADGTTAFVAAVESGWVDVAERLRARGADVKALDASGRGARARLDARIEEVAARVAEGERHRGIPAWLEPTRAYLERLRATRAALAPHLDR
ncbi:MAG: ankyrin repeat domain-containing protein [Planctomycetes bacterium]|nr:ankyrin repeat domain-containing protein [Planctomycetota bacterium]